MQFFEILGIIRAILTALVERAKGKKKVGGENAVKRVFGDCPF